MNIFYDFQFLKDKLRLMRKYPHQGGPVLANCPTCTTPEAEKGYKEKIQRKDDTEFLL